MTAERRSFQCEIETADIGLQGKAVNEVTHLIVNVDKVCNRIGKETLSNSGVETLGNFIIYTSITQPVVARLVPGGEQGQIQEPEFFGQNRFNSKVG